MRLWETAAVAFSMYSALPAPRVDWNENNLRYALAAFPLVGAAQGLFWWGVCALCAALDAPALLRGALLCVLPALLTGGIHLDGYADASDALASHADAEKMRAILRDPRCGAFAVIRLCLYFAVLFALCGVWEPTGAGCLCLSLGFVLSRALSGYLLTVLPVAPGSSLAKTFADAADKRWVGRFLLGLSALSAAGILYAGRAGGAAALLGAAAATAQYVRTAGRFGGTSGDLAGWFLVKTEFWMLAALVAAQLVCRHVLI